jgi:predicted DNA binding CopG/RHH family protein
VEEKMNKLKIPEVDSIEELARFWDMHDLTDFEDQLEEVPEPVFERKMEPVLVPLQSQEVEAVKRVAESEGIEYVALIRGWVLEKLHTY